MHKELKKAVSSKEKAWKECRQALIQEGRNQILYLLLVEGDDNVAHDHWHPESADVLVGVRRKIVEDLRLYDETGHINTPFPPRWPDFEAYTYCPG